MKREDIILTVGGSIAAIAVAYLIYRLQQRQAATAETNQENSDAEIQSELANQQEEYASSQISVPSISSTPSTTDTTNQATVPADYSGIENIVSAFQATNNSSVTNTITPIAAIGLLTSTENPSDVSLPYGTAPISTTVNVDDKHVTTNDTSVSS